MKNAVVRGGKSDGVGYGLRLNGCGGFVRVVVA